MGAHKSFPPHFITAYIKSNYKQECKIRYVTINHEIFVTQQPLSRHRDSLSKIFGINENDNCCIKKFPSFIKYLMRAYFVLGTGDI